VPAIWPTDPVVLIGTSAAAVAYVRASSRLLHADRVDARWRGRRRCFLAGLGVILVALQPPLDAFVDRSFTAHMVQHLLLTMVAAPLLVLGAPIRLALRAWPGDARRRLSRMLASGPVRTLSRPAIGWASFFVVLWATHLSSLFDLTLRSAAVHAGEHTAYLATALLFWGPVAGVDPSPARLTHAGRILFLFLAMPAMAFLGLAISTATHVLYPHYAAVEGIARALADQRAAGAVMWSGTMFLLVPALGFVLLDWMRADDREAARVDAALGGASREAAMPDRSERGTIDPSPEVLT